MKKAVKSLLSAVLILSAWGGSALAEGEMPIRLYTIDCGSILMKDLGLFSHEGKYDGQKNQAVDPCYLIRHPKGDLLWDAGLPEALINLPEGLDNGAFYLQVKAKLTDQLASIDVAPADIEFLSLSHSHFDHLGNAGKFAASTFIVHEAEYAAMFSDEARANTDVFSAYSALEGAEKIMFTENHDVFGDGSVVIHALPGHTVGHSVLMVKLQNAGNVLLTGDMYHLDRARELKTVPKFNSDIPQSLVSMEKFEALAAAENARVIIQHEKADFDKMPKFPAYLD